MNILSSSPFSDNFGFATLWLDWKDPADDGGGGGGATDPLITEAYPVPNSSADGPSPDSSVPKLLIVYFCACADVADTIGCFDSLTESWPWNLTLKLEPLIVLEKSFEICDAFDRQHPFINGSKYMETIASILTTIHPA